MLTMLLAAYLADWTYKDFAADPSRPTAPAPSPPVPEPVPTPIPTPMEPEQVPDRALTPIGPRPDPPPAAPRVVPAEPGPIPPAVNEPAPGSTLWQLADHRRQVWVHPDRAWLELWVAQRDQAALSRRSVHHHRWRLRRAMSQRDRRS